MAKDKIADWIMANQNRLLDLNRQFVSIPSINRYYHGGEQAAQQQLLQQLQQLGCETRQFLVTDVPGIEQHPAYYNRGDRDYQHRPNVVGRKRGKGQGRSLLFSGHMDTVPLDAHLWTRNPYGGEIVDGKQYGLGIYDMKSGIAAAISALMVLQELKIELNGNVMVESVVDEEFGGANGTLACRLQGYEADIAIVPEPTNGYVCPFHQGGGMYRIHISSQHSGRFFFQSVMSNPVMGAARMIDIFQDYQRYHANKPPVNKWYEGQVLPAYIQGVVAGNTELPLFDRSPSQFAMDVWIQCYPDTTEEQLYQDLVQFIQQHPRYNEISEAFEVRIEPLIRFLPGSGMNPEHEIFHTIRRVHQEMNLPIQMRGTPAAMDAFMFNLHSPTPAFIWGPTGGNAHAPDEFIDVEAHLQLVEAYARTMMEWCGVKS